MKDQSKTKQALIKEISVLKQRIQELEQSEPERNRMEQTYKDSELKYRSLIEHSSDVVFCVDKNGEYKFVNQVFASTFGKTPDFFLGKTFWDIYPKEHADHRQATSSKVFETGESQSVEVVVPLPDRTLYYIAKANPVRDETGKVVLNLTHAIDITDRKQAEEALRETESRYRQLFENAPAGIYEVDLTTGRLLSVNDALCEYTGYTKGELLTLNALDLLTEKSQKIFIERMAGYAAGEPVPSTLEYKAKKKSGQEFWISINPRYFYKEGIPVRASVVAHDITELKQAENALRESENKFRSFAEYSLVGIYLIQNGVLRYVNPKFAEIFGYTVEECLDNMFFRDLVYPDDYFTVKEQVRKRLSGESQSVHYSFRGIKKTGDIIQVEIFGTSILSNGKHTITGTILDITERKRAEEALSKSEEKYRTIIENMEDGYHEVDLKGNFTFFNESMLKILGYEREDLLGMNNRQYADEENTRKVYKVYNQVYRTGEPAKNFEWQIIRKDGDRRDIEVSISLIRNTEGHPTGFRGIVRDTTDRKRVENALRENKLFMEETQKIANLGGWKTNPRTDALLWNDGVYNIIEECRDYRPGLAEGVKYYHSEYLPALQSGLENCLATGNPFTLEAEITTAKGNNRWVEVRAFARTDSGGEPMIMGTIQDITERKRAEEEKRNLEARLQRAEKMESLGLMAGGVAHDLNNVLGVVVGYAEMLLLKANEASAIRPQLEAIMKGGQKAAAIVQDMLTLARRGVAGRDVLNLNKIIADFQKSPEIINLSFHHPSVKIKTDLEPDLPNISGSSVHLNKSIFNLVSNASEAMPKGGIMTIKTANHYLEKPIHGYDEIREGDYVVLSVSDTGDGIHETDIKRIFEPFYTKKVMGRSGTGLGLAVVWGTVKDHNGYINVESEEGKGSTFTLYFPVTREELSAEHPALSISEYTGKGESILIVDDVKGQRDLATVMLKELNYNVSGVKSGEEAVTYLKEHKADLIVLDMIMDPGMDGLDTYRSVLEIHPKQKAVIVSGFSETDRVKAAQALGAGAYVKKPYVIEKLGLAVRKELDMAT